MHRVRGSRGTAYGGSWGTGYGGSWGTGYGGGGPGPPHLNVPYSWGTGYGGFWPTSPERPILVTRELSQ